VCGDGLNLQRAFSRGKVDKPRKVAISSDFASVGTMAQEVIRANLTASLETFRFLCVKGAFDNNERKQGKNERQQQDYLREQLEGRSFEKLNCSKQTRRLYFFLGHHNRREKWRLRGILRGAASFWRHGAYFRNIKIQFKGAHSPRAARLRFL
jgi:hypothetical protein